MNEWILSLLVSGSLGALIGLERQWERQFGHPDRHVPAGLRTFALWGLTGNVCGLLAREWGALIFAAGLGAVGLWTALFLFSRSREKPGAGMTTASTGVLTFLIGGMVAAGQSVPALVLTVLVLLLLAGRSRLHAVTRKMTREDLRMALQFLAVSGAILPLVPDRTFGPYEAFNPRSVWLMVVMVSGLGFLGYLAVRWFGETKGIALTGIAGGLASSTATTLSMARLSRSRPAVSDDCTLAILLACTVMLWRVVVLIAAIHAELAIALIPDFAVLSLPGAIYAWTRWMHRGNESPAEGGRYRNPLSLKVAIQFGVLYAVVVLLVKVASAWFGGAGVMVASFLSGLTDLDAISLSLSNLSGNGGIAVPLAIQGILLATVANSLMKAGLAASLGSPELRRRTLLVLGVTAALGVAAMLVRLMV
ncbi:MAG: MgtC/SapB family protein [Terrimicrobiaceae bacterium]|nr:MgtC/SapB family protein [Terrimicrobiaceae bacterium]